MARERRLRLAFGGDAARLLLRVVLRNTHAFRRYARIRAERTRAAAKHYTSAARRYA